MQPVFNEFSNDMMTVLVCIIINYARSIWLSFLSVGHG